MNVWFITGMSTPLLVLIVSCIVMSIGIIIVCSKLNQRKKQKSTRKSRSHATRKGDEIILTRKNKCYDSQILNTTQEEPPHNYEDIELTNFTAAESAYVNVTLDGEQIAASPIESPTLVPRPMLTSSVETDADVAVVQIHVSQPLRKSFSLDRNLETITNETLEADSVSPNSPTRDVEQTFVWPRGKSTFVKQMYDRLERGEIPFRMSCKETSRPKGTYPARSQRSCCASNTNWSNGSICKPSIKVAGHYFPKVKDDGLSTCSITHSSSSDTELSLRTTSSKSLTSDHVSSASLTWGVHTSNRLELPSTNHRKRKAGTLNIHSSPSRSDQQPRDYEVPLSSNSMPRNMQPIY